MKKLAYFCALLSVVGALSTAKADVQPIPSFDYWDASGPVLMSGSGQFFPDSYLAFPGPPSDEFTALVYITGYWDNTDQYQVYVNGSPVANGEIFPVTSQAIDYGDRGLYTTPASAYATTFGVCPTGCPALFSTTSVVVNFGDIITIQDTGPLFYDAAASAAAGTPQYDAFVGLTVAGLLATPEPSFDAILGLGLLGLLFVHRRQRRVPTHRHL